MWWACEQNLSPRYGDHLQSYNESACTYRTMDHMLYAFISLRSSRFCIPAFVFDEQRD